MNDSRGGLLSAGGILAMIAGVFQLLGGGAVVLAMLLGITMLEEWWSHSERIIGVFPMGGLIVGAIIAVLGIIALVGGISAVRRKSFGLSLAGAICALPSAVLGLLALIFVALGRGEFEAT